MKSYPLYSFLSSLPDSRRKQGLRYPLGATLLMVVMSILNGCNSYREFDNFMKTHEEVLISTFGLKHGVPSYVSIRAIIMGVGIGLFSECFGKWMEQISSDSGEKWVSMDGKSIRSTVKHSTGKLQDFVQVVSLFGHNSHLVLGQQYSMHKKALEPQIVRQMIVGLDAECLIISLDALHCQKKL